MIRSKELLSELREIILKKNMIAKNVKELNLIAEFEEEFNFILHDVKYLSEKVQILDPSKNGNEVAEKYLTDKEIQDSLSQLTNKTSDLQMS